MVTSEPARATAGANGAIAHGLASCVRRQGGAVYESTNLESRTEPRFSYVLDRAIAHRCGVVIGGPPPAGVFVEVPRRALLDMMIESMRWHRQHEKATLYSVLNASRAWRFAAKDVLGSKLEGATWANRTEAEQEIRISWQRARDAEAAGSEPEQDSAS